jgi:hypothetical protein
MSWQLGWIDFMAIEMNDGYGPGFPVLAENSGAAKTDFRALTAARILPPPNAPAGPGLHPSTFGASSSPASTSKAHATR